MRFVAALLQALFVRRRYGWKAGGRQFSKRLSPRVCFASLPQVSCSGNSQKNPQVINAKLGDYWLSAYWGAVTDLALAYYYTENVAFAKRAITLTQAFFLDAKTGMKPNLLYGQMFPGV